MSRCLLKLVVSFLEYLLIMPHNLSLSEKKHVQIPVNLLQGGAEEQRGSSDVHSVSPAVEEPLVGRRTDQWLWDDEFLIAVL